MEASIFSNLFPRPYNMSQFLIILSELTGWCYFFLWGISFYPQFLTNYKIGHVEGYSADFSMLNISGFLFYLLYCIWGYIDSSKISGVVDIQDIAFASHSFLLTLLLIGQCLYYDKQFLINLHSWVKMFLGISWTLTIAFCTLEYFDSFPNIIPDLNGCLWLGYVKVTITIMKYLPQAVKNYKRKSTEGWNISTILLDISGGILSIFQTAIDSINKGNYGEFNIAKVCLGLISIVFDLVFIIQHYILYSDKSDLASPLLPKHRSSSSAESEIAIQI